MTTVTKSEKLGFEHLTPEHRELTRQAYLQNLAIERGQVQQKGITRMPWMIPIWEKGLSDLERVMKNKNEL